MHRLSLVTALSVIALLAASPCIAQQSPSRDFGVDFGMRAQSGRQVGAASSIDRFRFGFPLGASLSLEPTLSFMDPLGIGGEALPLIGVDATLGLALAYRVDASIAGGRPYFRPFVDLGRGGRVVALRADVGLGLGAEFPLRDALALRVEGSALRRLDPAFGGVSEERVTVGLTWLRH